MLKAYQSKLQHYFNKNQIDTKKTRRCKPVYEDKAGKWTLYEIVLLCVWALAFLIMYIRAFFGTEITDEAYYIGNAITIMHGNIPFAYNNECTTFGAYFMLIPQLFLYELLVPSFKGVFLFSRISFVTFKLIVLVVVYRILRKQFARKSVLCGCAVLIPFSAGIANYSYNSVSAFLTFLIAVILFDAVESSDNRTQIKVLISGFLSSLVFFTHIAYAVAIMVFILIILCRSKKGVKLKNILAYGIGGFSEVFLIFVPIAVQSGMKTLYDGAIRYIFPFPAQPMSESTWYDRIKGIVVTDKPYIKIMTIVVVCAVFFVSRYATENGEKYTKKEALITSLCLAQLACLYVMYQRVAFASWIYHIGLVSTVFITLFLFIKIDNSNSIFLYTSIYPIVFAVSMVVLTESNAALTRFIVIIPALSGIFIVLLENKREMIRLLTMITACVCVLLIGYCQCKYIYRDSEMSMLRFQVKDGVYAGIFTTEQRAHDLPEMEKCLNALIGEDELYAFRDNVPFAYLMNRKGSMCDLNTWDCLQYSYHWNIPARLFAYYKRRDCIPDKIVYIDFGRDEKLSIEDESYRYNDFVDSFYSLTEDFSLNDTFYHVMVYENAGNFDGNYDYWIDAYYGIPE